MFEINVQNPYVEYEGLYVKTYGDDGNKIASSGQLIGLIGVCLNFEARLRNAGSISEGEIATVIDGTACDDLDLALPFVMLFERFFTDVFHSSLPFWD